MESRPKRLGNQNVQNPGYGRQRFVRLAVWQDGFDNAVSAKGASEGLQ